MILVPNKHHIFFLDSVCIHFKISNHPFELNVWIQWKTRVWLCQDRAPKSKLHSMLGIGVCFGIFCLFVRLGELHAGLSQTRGGSCRPFFLHPLMNEAQRFNLSWSSVLHGRQTASSACRRCTYAYNIVIVQCRRTGCCADLQINGKLSEESVQEPQINHKYYTPRNGA